MNVERLVDDAFHQLNQVRSSPHEYAEIYAQLTNRYKGKIFRDRIKTREGVAAVNDLVATLNARKSCPNHLKWSFALHMAADEQARKLGGNGLLTTEGTLHHKILPDRCKQFSVLRGRVSEVYEFGGQSAEEVLEWLLLDDGLASRKRRDTLLDPIYNFIGIGSCLHETQGFVTVIILAEDVISLGMTIL